MNLKSIKEAAAALLELRSKVLSMEDQNQREAFFVAREWGDLKQAVMESEYVG